MTPDADYRRAALELAEKEGDLTLYPLLLLAMIRGGTIALQNAVKSYED